MIKKTIPQCKKALWRYFSEYIRKRDSRDGIGKCISCNKEIQYGPKWHAGHYYPRSAAYMNLYFNEKNVNGQCAFCNRFLQGNMPRYALGLARKYGKSVIEELDEESRKPMVKLYSSDYEDLISKYKKKLKRMS